ncbi:microtubule-associated protein tau [Dermacentor variabilis]|uniref:microtubule-associated protein tau n=1 Tax=Dermacentor variabilis TaxID=34621 RepID=UPI003F5C467A
MDKASAAEVSQPSAAQTAARSDDTASADASAKPSTTADDQAQRHHDLLPKTVDPAAARGAANGHSATQEPAKPREGGVAPAREASGESERTAPVPSVSDAGGGEKPVPPAKSQPPPSDEKQSSGAAPSTYPEPERISTEVPEKKPVMEDKTERTGPEKESREVPPSAPAADRDGAVPSQEKQQQERPESDSSGAKQPAKEVESAKEGGAKGASTQTDQEPQGMAEEKPGAKTADAVASPTAGATREEKRPEEASSEVSEAAPSESTKVTSSAAEAGEGKAENGKPSHGAVLPQETCKSVADAGTKLPQEHASPGGDGASLQPSANGAGDAKQPTPDDTRPKSSIPPPPVYEAPSRTGSAKDEPKQAEEDKQKTQMAEQPAETIKGNGPVEAARLQEVTESIMPATACHTGTIDTVRPDAIRKESAPKEAYSSSAPLDDLLDEEAIRAQLYPAEVEGLAPPKGERAKEPEASEPQSVAKETEKSAASGLPSSSETKLEPGAKTPQPDVEREEAHGESRDVLDADVKAGEREEPPGAQVPEKETVIPSEEVTKEEKPEKVAKEVLPSAPTTKQAEAPEKEEKPADKVEKAEELEKQVDATPSVKTEGPPQESKVTGTAPLEDSAEREDEKAKAAASPNKQDEKTEEKAERVAKEDDAKEVAPPDATQEPSEPSPAKEETTQVRDVTAESDKPSKEAERTHEVDSAKDTSKAAASPEPGVGEKEPSQTTEETLSIEKEADQNVPKEAEGGPEELDVQELPPQEPGKPDEIKANEETAAPKLSDAVAEPENKEIISKSAEEPSKAPPGDSEVSGAPEPATEEEAPTAVEAQEGVLEITKDKAEASEEEVVKTDEIPVTTAVEEEAAQPEPTDEGTPQKVEDEAPESGDKASEEATTKVEAAQKEAEEPGSDMPVCADETAEQASEDQGGEEAATAAEAEPEAADESKKSSEAAEESEKPTAEAVPEEKTEEATDGPAPSELEPTQPAEAVKKKTGLPKSPSKRATGKGPPRTLDKKETSAAADAKAKTPSSPKKPSSIHEKGGPSPKKTAPTKNGVTSPSKTARTPGSEQKKLPPIKAPVGQAPKPDLKNVRSKIGSLDNIKHKPKGGEVKVTTQKLEWRAAPKVGSLDNAAHKPGGGDKKILSQKLDFKAQSKVGSLDNVDHKPTGGQVKVETQKLDFKDKASSKVGSLDNVKHKAGGGNVKILSEKLEFKERAASKIGSLPASDAGSTRGSESLSPTNLTSPLPAQSQQSQEDDVAAAANGHESDISPTKDEVAAPSSGVPATAPPPEVAQC